MFCALLALTIFSCKDEQKKPAAPEEAAAPQPDNFDNFEYSTEQFADLRILRYNIPGFNALSAKQQELLYYLSEAGCMAAT
jgi:dipeptidyl-peptidase-3